MKLRPIIFLLIAVTFAGVMLFKSVEQKQTVDYFMEQHNKMMDLHIAKRGIIDTQVLKAMKNVKRHQFVPDESKAAAYGDHPLPIGHGQTISQPYIVAYMSQELGLKKDDRVLEIGTGSGYQAAILAEIVKEVYTIEIVEPLANSAKKRLAELGYTNVFVKHGDGYEGWAEHAPYDAIIVTAAPNTIPSKLVDQLRVGGQMIVPVGGMFQQLQMITKEEKGYVMDRLLSVRFVPMVKDDE